MDNFESFGQEFGDVGCEKLFAGTGTRVTGRLLKVR